MREKRDALVQMSGNISEHVLCRRCVEGCRIANTPEQMNRARGQVGVRHLHPVDFTTIFPVPQNIRGWQLCQIQQIRPLWQGAQVRFHGHRVNGVVAPALYEMGFVAALV